MKCTLKSLVGYSNETQNSVVNAASCLGNGVLLPLVNSLWHFDGTGNHLIKQLPNQISAVYLRGSTLLLGEQSSKGKLISAVLLDILTPEVGRTFSFQKSSINYLSISPDNRYIVSVGSSDKFNQELVVVDIHSQSSIGTTVFFKQVLPTKDGVIKQIAFLNGNPQVFGILFTNKVTLMTITEKTLEAVVAKISKVRRFTGMVFDQKDQFCYCCSENGDLSEISLKQLKETRVGPRKRIILNGIFGLRYIAPEYLVITGRHGMVALIEIKTMALIREIAIPEQIVSISEFIGGLGYISTAKASIYRLSLHTFEAEIYYSCHSAKVNQVCFLSNFPDIFATCSGGEIIEWNASTFKPILRIALPKITCFCLDLSKNGKAIISGWSDDCIRIFGPCDGKLLHKIGNTTLGSVLKLLSLDNSLKLLAGGQRGSIKMWSLQQNKDFMILGSMSYHCSAIRCMRINPWYSSQLVTCCDDGEYAVWDLKHFQLMFNCVVANFLTDLYYLDNYTIRLVGSGQYFYDCYICEGKVINKGELTVSSVNCALQYSTDSNDYWFFFAGKEPFLNFSEKDLYNRISLRKIEAYSEISTMQISPSNGMLVAGTASGAVLGFQLQVMIRSKTLMEDQTVHTLPG